ncbi:MAG: DUF4176 domain-containing protein [Synergistales bacterium]|nr:DUF4176 domain-containing protein [Synergistales bacterium]
MTGERIDQLLPVGSVVLLEGAQKPLLIFGVCQTEKNSGEDYDYIGVFYPEGNIGSETQFLFNQADVDRVVFTGYDSPENQAFRKKLKAFYAQKNQSE